MATTLEQLLLTARQNADQWLTGQKAQAQAQYDAEANALRKALEMGIQEQNQLSAQAQRDYENQVAQINQQVYNDSQARQLMGYAGGMQNSQQFLAQIAGDQYRRQQLDAGVAKDRNARLSDIANRIASLKTQTDYDLASALSGFNSRVAGLSSEAENMYNQNVLSLREKQLEQQYALERMAREYALAGGGSGGGGSSRSGTSSGTTGTLSNLSKAVGSYNQATKSTALDKYYNSQSPQVKLATYANPMKSVAPSAPSLLKKPAQDKNLTDLQRMNMMTNKSPKLTATAKKTTTKKTTTARKNQLR